MRTLKSHFSKEKTTLSELRIRHKDGGWIWVLDRGQVLSWTDKGQPLEMYGTHQNIEALKSAQAQASRLGTLFDSVLPSSHICIHHRNRNENGTITVFNAGAEKCPDTALMKCRHQYVRTFAFGVGNG